MKTKIIIVGAGHGGVVCGALLAEKGYDVTVYEKNKRRDIGHDQTDVFPLSCFEDVGIPLPPRGKYVKSTSICYTNPSGTVRLQMPPRDETKPGGSVMDRKYLIHYLIKYAEKKGVKFRFDTQVICPVNDGKKVFGITVKKGNRYSNVFADLIIDAAGLDSPIRSLLPSAFGIKTTFDDDQVFTCYRVFLEKTEPYSPKEKYTVHFFHMRNPGISWVIAEKGCYDVLIGRFGTTLTNENIEAALADLKSQYKGMGDKVIRGGHTARIPIRRTIPLMIANGYAAIGDSAGMTIPIIGSGIANSIRAAKYLADAVIKNGDGDMTAEALWQYQYNYFTNIGNKLVIVDKLRSVCTRLTADDMDYLLEKGILSENELAMGSVELSVTRIIQKVIKALPKIQMLANLTRTFARHNSLKKILAQMPENYDANAVREWTERYETA